MDAKTDGRPPTRLIYRSPSGRLSVAVRGDGRFVFSIREGIDNFGVDDALELVDAIQQNADK